MGGKRPDQYRIDRDEAGATDHKNLPDTPAEGRRKEAPYEEGMKRAAHRPGGGAEGAPGGGGEGAPGGHGHGGERKENPDHERKGGTRTPPRTP